MSNHIRTNWKSRAIGWLGGWTARIWCQTLRYHIQDEIAVGNPHRPAIIACLWHNRIFAAGEIARRHRGKRPGVVLTSASHDGEALASAMKVFSLGAIRGSTSRRGRKALSELIRALNQGQDVCITPDGPRGPVYQIQPGLLKLAQVTGAEVVPFIVEPTQYWELNTWDRFRIPKPFTQVTIIWRKGIPVPRSLSEEQQEHILATLQNQMKHPTNSTAETPPNHPTAQHKTTREDQ